MSVSVGLSTAGNFVTQAYFPATGETLAQAGVTDTALLNKMDQAAQSGGNSQTNTMKFLDSLSSSQLDEVTIGCFDSGQRVTTYGDYKTYLNLIQSLSNSASSLMAGDSTAIGNVSSSTSNSNEAEAVRACDLINDIVNNKSDCITNAESYLEGASSTSGISTMVELASGKSKTGGSASTLTSSEIQEIFSYHSSEAGAVTAASLANWGKASSDNVLDQDSSNKLIDTAASLATEA